jgi:hypothetical protein
MKKVLVLAAALAVGSSAFAFSKGQTDTQVAAEVSSRVANGESIESIARDAAAVGIAPAAVQSALVSAGKDSTAVFNSMVAAGSDPTALTPPTAAGGNNAGGNNAGGNSAGGSFTGTTNSSFGQSRATTVGGGGAGSVSKS